MTKFTFFYFTDYEDGKMARLGTVGDWEIPVNIFIDNAAELEGITEGPCSVDVCGVGSDVEIFASEEEYRASGSGMDVLSMIPIGTFPADEEDKDFEESPHILFTGKVRAVEWNPAAEEEAPNGCLWVETLGLELKLYVRYEGAVEPGYLVHGVAWLFGDMVQESI